MGEVHWTTYITAFATPLVAAMAIYIAWRQWQTAQEKLRLELFDKRVKVHEALTGALQEIFKRSPSQGSDNIEYQAEAFGAPWLFGSEVKNYLSEFQVNAAEFLLTSKLLRGDTITKGRAEMYERREALWRWFTHQPAHIEMLFMPYLDFRSLRGTGLRRYPKVSDSSGRPPL